MAAPFTHGHHPRLTSYAHMIAKTMRLPADKAAKVRAAAAVHDVGKINVPGEILNKPGRLTDDEFDVMKGHSAAGAEMVERIGDPEITAMVRHHHERMDGRGYPDGLKGKSIPLGARVIAVADTFDAIISTRPYRNPRKHKDAIEIIKRAAGTQLDEQAVDAFLSYYSGRRPLAWWLSISTAVQRVLGGIGGWLQHAKATGLSQGTVSLAAAVALSSVASAIDPGAIVGRNDAPAEKSKRVIAAEDHSSPVAALAVDRDVPRPAVRRVAPAAPATSVPAVASAEATAFTGHGEVGAPEEASPPSPQAPPVVAAAPASQPPVADAQPAPGAGQPVPSDEGAESRPAPADSDDAPPVFGGDEFGLGNATTRPAHARPTHPGRVHPPCPAKPHEPRPAGRPGGGHAQPGPKPQPVDNGAESCAGRPGDVPPPGNGRPVPPGRDGEPGNGGGRPVKPKPDHPTPPPHAGGPDGTPGNGTPGNGTPPHGKPPKAPKAPGATPASVPEPTIDQPVEQPAAVEPDPVDVEQEEPVVVAEPEDPVAVEPEPVAAVADDVVGAND